MRTDWTHFGWTLLILTFIMGAAPDTAHAQGFISYVSAGPVFVRGIGIREFAWRVGGGTEILDGPVGLGVSADFVHFPEVTRRFDAGRGSASSPPFSTGTLAFNATFYFGGTVIPRRVRPYVAGGLAYLLRSESLATLDVAAGLDWWTRDRAGFRFEIREQYPAMLSIRAGLVFR